MDARPWQAIPPPPAFPPPPPYRPDFGYVIPAQAAPPMQRPPTDFWAAPSAPAAEPVRRGQLLAWLAAGMAVLVTCVPLLLGSLPHSTAAEGAGLHSVDGISAAPWSAEFLDASGLPARWDPCTPIPYVVDLEYAPAGALADVQEAFARLSAATGMTFASDGPTAERPSRARSAYQPAVYGHAWAPILISWSPPADTDLLTDPQSEAVTVPIAVNSASGTGGGSIVSAEIVLNTDRQLPVGFGPGPSEGEVLMHELGHAVGLGHVSSTTEAMYPTVRGIAAYGPGDLAGFAAVGRPAGCHAAPAAHQLDVLQLPQG